MGRDFVLWLYQILTPLLRWLWPRDPDDLDGDGQFG